MALPFILNPTEPLISAVGHTAAATANMETCPKIPKPYLQVVLFLDKLVEYRSLQAMHPKTTRRMDELYSFDSSHNAEVRSSWYRLCLAAGASRDPCRGFPLDSRHERGL